MLGLDVHDMEGLGEEYVGYDETVDRSDEFGLKYLRFAKTLSLVMYLPLNREFTLSLN